MSEIFFIQHPATDREIAYTAAGLDGTVNPLYDEQSAQTIHEILVSGDNSLAQAEVLAELFASSQVPRRLEALFAAMVQSGYISVDGKVVDRLIADAGDHAELLADVLEPELPYDTHVLDPDGYALEFHRGAFILPALENINSVYSEGSYAAALANTCGAIGVRYQAAVIWQEDEAGMTPRLARPGFCEELQCLDEEDDALPVVTILSDIRYLDAQK